MLPEGVIALSYKCSSESVPELRPVLSWDAPRIREGSETLLEEDLQVARKNLQEEQAIVLAELADLGFTADGKVDIHLDEGFADAAQTTSERARVISLAEGLQERLENVQDALARIEKGTYGLCERCGKEIAPERLEAIPSAKLCMACKSKK